MQYPKKGKISNEFKGGFSAQLSNQSYGIDIFLAVNLDLLSDLDNNLRSNFIGSGGINPEDMNIKISANNDTRDTYSLTTEGVFLDGLAIITGTRYTVDLERRSESVVTLADVSVSTLTGRGWGSFAYVGTVSPKTPDAKK